MMKKITKFVTLLLALAMVFSLAACSSGKGKDKADGSADIATLIGRRAQDAQGRRRTDQGDRGQAHHPRAEVSRLRHGARRR